MGLFFSEPARATSAAEFPSSARSSSSSPLPALSARLQASSHLTSSSQVARKRAGGPLGLTSNNLNYSAGSQMAQLFVPYLVGNCGKLRLHLLIHRISEQDMFNHGKTRKAILVWIGTVSVRPVTPRPSPTPGLRDRHDVLPSAGECYTYCHNVRANSTHLKLKPLPIR
jgi:hypothetical protein